jgi:hypothetical protein
MRTKLEHLIVILNAKAQKIQNGMHARCNIQRFKKIQTQKTKARRKVKERERERERGSVHNRKLIAPLWTWQLKW